MNRLRQLDLSLCLQINRAGAYPLLTGFFLNTSRLGNGVFRYSMMIALPVVYGAPGFNASLHMLTVAAHSTLAGITILHSQYFVKIPGNQGIGRLCRDLVKGVFSCLVLLIRTTHVTFDYAATGATLTSTDSFGCAFPVPTKDPDTGGMASG